MNAADLAWAIAEQHSEWAMIEGCRLLHTERGEGKVEKVEQRANYWPLFHVRFAAGLATLTPKSFANGKSTIPLRPDSIARVEELRSARLAQERAAEIAAAKALEYQRELDEIRARQEWLASLPLEERHRIFLEELGIAYKGVRAGSSRVRFRRVTHCYICRKHLDNAVDVECVACGWILCTCGACGCGFSGGSV